jgi:DNA-binding transcriptional LysR family regulator
VPGPDDLDWDDLRYFLRAARFGSFARAARALRVEHSTVSRRLKALEEHIGAALMLRRPDGIQPTEVGKKLLPILEAIERSVAAAHALVASEKARVRLAMPSGFMRVFTNALADLRQTHPEISVEIVSGSRPVNLERGEADLAIRSRAIVSDDLVARKLCVAGWSLYASEAYLARHPGKIDVDNLAGHEVIGFDASLAGSPGGRWVAARAKQVTVTMRGREMVDMIAAAASGIGIALVPCVLGDAEPKLKRLARQIVVTHEMALVYRREARLSPNVRLVARAIFEAVKHNAALITGVR